VVRLEGAESLHQVRHAEANLQLLPADASGLNHKQDYGCALSARRESHRAGGNVPIAQWADQIRSRLGDEGREVAAFWVYCGEDNVLTACHDQDIDA